MPCLAHKVFARRVQSVAKMMAYERGFRLQSFRWEGFTLSTITIELPADVVPDATTPEEFAQDLRLAAAIHWYSRGEISQGKGAQIAGLDRRSFIVALGRAGVDAIQIGPEELNAEVERELAARRQRLANHLPSSSGPSGAVERTRRDGAGS
jgi:predicted HTH domain antitoxin